MEKVRVGIIGTGGMSQGHMRKVLQNPDAEITALCDNRPEALANTVEKHEALKDVPQFADYRELIGSGLVDAVYIVTPHTIHYEEILAALDAGLHIYGEKPLVCNVTDAKHVLKRIDEVGKIFVLGYQRHYQAEFLYIKKAISSGEYGAVQFVQGLQGQEWLRACANSWRHELKWSGGGQLNDSGSHMLAVLLFVTGLSVKSVYAQMENFNVEVDINSSLTLQFDGGAIGSISIVGNAPSWYEDITIWCEKGAFYMRNGKLEVSDAVGKRHFPIPEDLPEGGNPDDNFIAAILGKEEVGGPPIWGLKVIELTEAAWESAKTGQLALVDKS